MQKQMRTPLIVFAYIALGLASAGVLAADESDDLDALQAKAQKELLAAKMAFRIRLPILPEYQKAKRILDDLGAKISDLQAANASNSEVDAAIRSKIAAEKSLQAVPSELEKKDPALAQVNEKIKKLSDRMDVLRQQQAPTNGACYRRPSVTENFTAKRTKMWLILTMVGRLQNHGRMYHWWETKRACLKFKRILQSL